MTYRVSSSLLLASAAVVLGSASPPVITPAVAQQFAVEEITVTARRREERLQDIPLAITAFTASDIATAGIQDLNDLALMTVGMDFDSRSGGNRTPGRVNSVIRLRGVDNGTLDHLQPTSVFVDGIYVLGTAGSMGLQDLERVEVIKGPQSAFFGRNTFAGAINYITKTPSLDEFETKLDFSMATYEKFDGNIITSGPIIPGKLAFQFNGRLYNRGAEWQANDGGEMGAESTSFASFMLYGEPNEKSSFKLRAYYQFDDDKSPVAGLIRGRFADTCTGTSVERLNSQGVTDTFFPRDYICGAIPKFGYVEQSDPNHPFAGPNFPIHGPGFQGGPRRLLSHETTFDNPIFARDLPGFDGRIGGFSFFGPQPGFIQKTIGGTNVRSYIDPDNPRRVPQMDGFGMKRKQIRFSLNSDYEFDNGYTATLLAGYSDMRQTNLWDYDSTDDPVWYSADPKIGIDWSVEARINSPEDERFRWLAGATLYDQEFIANGGGGLLVSACFLNCDLFTPAVFTLPPTSGNQAKVWGVYGSISYDITDDLTLDIEARYLQDRRSVSESGIEFKNTFKQTTPRAILSYRPTEETTLYAQWSKGVLPGTTNAIVAACSEDEFLASYPDPRQGPNQGQPRTDSECDQIRAIVGEDRANPATPTQKLTSMEIGIKQTFMDNRVRANLTAWHYEWANRPFGATIVWVRDAEVPSARDRLPNPFPNNQGMSIPGSQKLWGSELETGFVFTENWDAQVNVSWSDNKFTEFEQFSFSRITDTGRDALDGVTNMTGQKINRYPTWAGNLATTYTNELNNTWDYFGRVDVLYKGSYWADNINLAKTEAYFLTNARIGLQREDLRIEIYVRNLFQEDAWATVSPTTDISSTAFEFSTIRGLLVTPQEKRTFGLRTNLSF